MTTSLVVMATKEADSSPNSKGRGLLDHFANGETTTRDQPSGVRKQGDSESPTTDTRPLSSDTEDGDSGVATATATTKEESTTTTPTSAQQEFSSLAESTTLSTRARTSSPSSQPDKESDKGATQGTMTIISGQSSNLPVYTQPAILELPPTAVLTKQEMDFRANLLNPNNDLFWTARGLVRPPVLADALPLGHDLLRHEGHLTQKQGGRRMSAQHGSSGGAAAMGQQMSNQVGQVPPVVAAAIQNSWRAPTTPAPLAPNSALITKQEMDLRANQLNPNNDVFWTSRGLVRPPVLADALAKGHAILQKEGHQTQAQTHKSRSRLNSVPSLRGAEPNLKERRRQSTAGRSVVAEGAQRRASIAGTYYCPPSLRGSQSLPLGGESMTKDEVDLRANMMNPNNSVFWTSRGLNRPSELQDALQLGHAVLEAEGHTSHSVAGGGGGMCHYRAATARRRSSISSSSWNRRGADNTQTQPTMVSPSLMVSPLVTATQQQWITTPFLAPNAQPAAGLSLASQTPGRFGALRVSSDWQQAAAAMMPQQPHRRRYSLPPPGFEFYRPPSATLMSITREGAADSEWDTMDQEVAAAASKVLAPPPRAAVPIVRPPLSQEDRWPRRPPPSSDAAAAAKTKRLEEKQTEDAKAAEGRQEEAQKMHKEDKGGLRSEDLASSGSREPLESKAAPTHENWEDRTDLIHEDTKTSETGRDSSRKSESSSQSAAA